MNDVSVLREDPTMNDVNAAIDVSSEQKSLKVVNIDPPPEQKRAQREAQFVKEREKKNRYHLPNGLDSYSPVGYRHRVPFTTSEAKELMSLLSLERPTEFLESSKVVTEQELFEETSLGILTSRQSTNFNGHREVILGPDESKDAADLIRDLEGVEAGVLENATHTHLVFSRPYRTLFTFLLTFVGHKPLLNLLTVPWRAIKKVLFHEHSIPSTEYLQHLHVGILADEMERAAVVASEGRRKAQVLMAPFAGEHKERNTEVISRLESLAGKTVTQSAKGWELALVAQVGEVPKSEQLQISPDTLRKFGANKIAFRSERIQPGVNADDNAPEGYQERQGMTIPGDLVTQCGRAIYNAFSHWTGVERDRAKELLLLDRIDVLSEDGKQKLRNVREMLDKVTDKVVDNLPLWADILSGFSLSRGAEKGRKAFALAGQRMYLGGIDFTDIEASGLDPYRAIRATGAASARSALYAEMMGCVDLPDDCDLLAGICQMAGPVNQNDIGKQFYGQDDLLEDRYPDRDPTSMLVWTLKAKTIADPIGNEEQLLNEDRKGALVDIRPGPHDIIHVKKGLRFDRMRCESNRKNRERAFADIGNFVTSPWDEEIPGNRGEPWPEEKSRRAVWNAD